MENNENTNLFDSAVDLPDIDIGTKTEGYSYVAEPDAKNLAIKFGIIGTGQGGSKLADTFYQIGYRRVCAINTTAQDFLGLTIPQAYQKVLVSQGGAGKDPSKGWESLTSSKEDVLNLMRHTFGEDVERIMICVGAGGGSGGGSAIPLFKLAKYYLANLGKPEKVGMIVTLPKRTEGGKVQANAYRLLSDLKALAESKAVS